MPRSKFLGCIQIEVVLISIGVMARIFQWSRAFVGITKY
jgi:hypothetical protein